MVLHWRSSSTNQKARNVWPKSSNPCGGMTLVYLDHGMRLMVPVWNETVPRATSAGVWGCPKVVRNRPLPVVLLHWRGWPELQDTGQATAGSLLLFLREPPYRMTTLFVFLRHCRRRRQFCTTTVFYVGNSLSNDTRYFDFLEGGCHGDVYFI